MNERLWLAVAVALASALGVIAQQSPNPDATRRAPRGQLRIINPTPTPTRTPGTPEAKRARRAPTPVPGASDPTVQGVIATFDALVDGIERSDVEAVTGLYWESPQLNIFNNNGTITRGWEQLRENRAASYPEAKNVSLEIRNRSIHMMGREGAVLFCQWTQKQYFRGDPESATGRLTVVFRRIGQTWKIIHTHTSPEAPDPSRIMPSEQDPPAAAPAAVRPRSTGSQ